MVVLQTDTVGSSLPWETVEWEELEAQLYAVGVGAGQDNPSEELAYTTGNSRGVTARVLPTFATILAHFKPTARHSFGTYSTAALVHAEQSVRFFQPLSPRGRLDVSETLTGFVQKPRGVLVTTHTAARAAATQETMFETYASYYIIGAEVAASRTVREDGLAPWVAPPSPETPSVHFRIPPNQALIYRLSGDFNPLHTDPHVAREGGFDRPILHGLCTYGYAFRLLSRVFDLEAPGTGQFDMRFLAPVYPGDALELRYWEEEGGVYFTIDRADGESVARGALLLNIPRPSYST